MRQFDLVDNPSERSRGVAPYLLVLQSHLLEGADSVIVAPLVRDVRAPFSGIDLAVEVSGETLTATLVELFSIERRLLKTVRGNLADHEDEIRRGLERLFTGF
ncbi:MAG TPA: CcdB family protein [Phenylobacterium sp.]|nr:CcdB family protein [Phenylobacterium sp.]